MTTLQIIRLLNDFVPFHDDDIQNDNESYFYDSMDYLKSNDDFEMAIEPIFKLIEKYPFTDFGSPGPFVHALESFTGQYESYLFESLNRKPTLLTIWMLNRIISAEQNNIIKQNLVDRLNSFIQHPLIDKETTNSIRGFVAYQNKNKKLLRQRQNLQATYALALCQRSKGFCVVGILLNFSTLAVGKPNLRPSQQ